MRAYNIVEDTSMPGEDAMQGPFYAPSVEACAKMCDRQNALLAGFRNEGAIGTGYSFQHCNGFTYDRLSNFCQLKNKAMGNFDLTNTTTSPLVEEAPKSNVRYVSGYRWNSLVNEINDTFPNGMGGYKQFEANASWSEDNYAGNGSMCT